MEPQTSRLAILRKVFFILLGLGVLVLILWYVNTYIYQFLAGEEKSQIVVSSQSDQIEIPEDNTPVDYQITFAIAPPVTGDYVSGFQLLLTYDNQILDYKEIQAPTWADVIANEEAEAPSDTESARSIIMVAKEPMLLEGATEKSFRFSVIFTAQDGADTQTVTEQKITLKGDGAEVVGESKDGEAAPFPAPDDAYKIISIIRATDQDNPSPQITIVPICQEIIDAINARIGARCGGGEYAGNLDLNADGVIDSADLAIVRGRGDDATYCQGIKDDTTSNPCATITPSTEPQATATPTPTPEPGETAGPVTPSPSPVPSTSGNTEDVSLNMKLRFQGVTKQPAGALDTLNVQVELVSDRYKENKIIAFKSDGNAVWSGSGIFTRVPIAEKYSLLIKGPKHLAKRICVNSPRETVAGTYNCDNDQITLAKGNNDLDFSNVTLLAGDLPIQNSIVDSADIVYIRQNFGNQGSDAVARGDLNLDGIVDTQDFAMVLAALGFKYDEDL